MQNPIKTAGLNWRKNDRRGKRTKRTNSSWSRDIKSGRIASQSSSWLHWKMVETNRYSIEIQSTIFKSYELLQGVAGYQPLRTENSQSSGFVESFLHLQDAEHQLPLGLRDLKGVRGVIGHGNHWNLGGDHILYLSLEGEYIVTLLYFFYENSSSTNQLIR